jgi:hypothetical protein
MGPDCDISLYDLMARRVLACNSQYHDLFDGNFPGIVWLHSAIRAAFGWRSEVLRAVDLAVVGAIVGLLVGWLPRSVPAAGRIGVGAVLAGFYLSTSEWCHCQRDVWMLLPCLVGLRLRDRQADRHRWSELPSRLFAWAAVEGVVWGAAVWIKPFAAVPGLVIWTISARRAANGPAAGRRLAADLAGILTGGLLAGAAGAAWLLATGAWSSFVEIMFVWNREYATFNTLGGPWWYAPLGLTIRLFPWPLVHFAAVPLALQTLMRGKQRPSAGPSLRAGFYLAWLGQACLLQHVYDYVHTPAILLAVALLAVDAAERVKSPGGRLTFLFLACCVAWKGIGLTADRAAAWSECVRAGSTPAVRDRVGLLHRINWGDLSLVSQYLRGQEIRDGELTCFTLTTMSLYNELDQPSSTRFLFLQECLNIYTTRRDEILRSLVTSRQKILVCDLDRPDMQGLRARLDRDESDPRPAWKDRVLFRAGNYVVFQLRGDEMPDWLAVLRP